MVDLGKDGDMIILIIFFKGVFENEEETNAQPRTYEAFRYTGHIAGGSDCYRTNLVLNFEPE